MKQLQPESIQLDSFLRCWNIESVLLHKSKKRRDIPFRERTLINFPIAAVVAGEIIGVVFPGLIGIILGESTRIE